MSGIVRPEEGYGVEVRRVPNQGGGTLREFYAECSAIPTNRSADIGRRMLALLDALDAPGVPPLWGMTSHLALHLFTTPTGAGETCCVHGHGPGYVVEASRNGDASHSWVAAVGGAVALVLAALTPSGAQPSGRRPEAEPGAAPDHRT